jgi:hypothetical protein
MYLHIGQEVMLRTREIVAIIDRQILEQSEETRQFFNRLRAMDLVEGDLNRAKSLIITDHKIYCSKISALTLARRGAVFG